LKEQELIDLIEKHVKYEEGSIEVYAPRKLKFILKKDDLVDTLLFLKRNGFVQLSFITCVDWIKDNKFELVYGLVSWEHKLTVLVKTFIDRDNPKMISIMDIWPTAKYYEQEINEFFGVYFEGNPNMSKELILENWDSMPPLRKDFDPQSYSNEKFEIRIYDYKMEDKKKK